MLVPSLSCPAECKYCFGPHHGPVMSKQIMDSTLDYISNIIEKTRHNKNRITFHGGEPLVAGTEIFRQAFNGLNNRIRGPQCDIAIQSNLWLLNDEFCNLFKENRCEVGTSLDGPEHLTDLQRGSGYYARTMKGIQKAQEYGLNINCIATFTPINLPYWREIFDFFLNERLNFSIHASVPQLNKDITSLNLKPQQYAKLLLEMLDYYIDHRRDIEVSSLDQMCKTLVSGKGKICTFCDCLGMFLAIDPLGGIYPCQRFCGRPEYSMGNIANNPDLHDLLKSEVANKMAIRQKTIKNICMDCSHMSYCKGGCTYNAWASGYIENVKDPYCQAYSEIFEHIQNRLASEISSEKNFQTFIDSPEEGILREGKLIELVRPGSHPYRIARIARRIVGAVELAKGPDITSAAIRLTEMGVCRTLQSAKASLQGLQRSLNSNSIQLNKLYLHITFDCQLSCTHCYIRAGQNHQSEQKIEMSPESIKSLILQAKNASFNEVVITGGEPLYHSQYKQLLRTLGAVRMQVKPMQIVLRTNFSLPLKESTMIELADAVDQFTVSVDGDELMHNKRRGEGAYSAVIRNLEKYTRMRKEGFLISNSAKLSLSATLSIKDINDNAGLSVKQLGKRLNIRRIRFRPILPLGRASDWQEPPVSEALGAYADPMELIENGFQPLASCGIGQNLYVEPSGDSFPCYAYHKGHAYLGNVINKDLKFVIESSKFRNLSCHTVETNPKCAKCHLRYLCGGACRAWGGHITQYNLDEPPPECDGLQLRADALYKAACDYLELNHD